MSINETRRPCSMGLPAIPCYSILFLWLWPWSRSQHIQQQLSISGKDGSAPLLAWRGVGALSPRVQRHRGVRSAESEWQAETKMASFQGSNSRDISSQFFCVKIIWVKLSIWQYLTVSEYLGSASYWDEGQPFKTNRFALCRLCHCQCWPGHCAVDRCFDVDLESRWKTSSRAWDCQSWHWLSDYFGLDMIWFATAPNCGSKWLD